MLSQFGEAFGVALNIVPVVKLFGDDHMHDRVEHRHVGTALELQHVGRIARKTRLPFGVHDDQLGATFGGVFEKGRRHRMVDRRVGANHDDHLGIQGFHERRGHRARTDAFHQRRHRTGVTQPGAVIDVVGLKRRADQLLEQIGFFVGAFGRAEPGQRRPTVTRMDFFQARSRLVQRLFPGRFTEMAQRIGRIEPQVFALRYILAADQRDGQAMGVMHVVEPVTSFNAQPLPVGRTIAPGHAQQAAVAHVIGQLAADSAIGANAFNLLVALRQTLGNQRIRRTSRDAFATGDAGRQAHGIAHVKNDGGLRPAPGQTDHVVALNVAASPHTTGAENTFSRIERDGRIACVYSDPSRFACGPHLPVALRAGLARINSRGLNGPTVTPCREACAEREAAVGYPHHLGPVAKLGLGGLGIVGQIGDQQFEDDLTRRLDPFAVGLDHHAVFRRAVTRRGQRPFAFDLDHASPAIAVRAEPRLGDVTEPGNIDPFAQRHRPQRIARPGGNRSAVQRKGLLGAHRSASLN